MSEVDKWDQAHLHLQIRAITGVIIKASTSSKSMLRLIFHFKLLRYLCKIMDLVCSEINQPRFIFFLLCPLDLELLPVTTLCANI